MNTEYLINSNQFIIKCQLFAMNTHWIKIIKSNFTLFLTR